MVSFHKLFLTGPIKSGKSTLLLSALKAHRLFVDGFYVQRQRIDEHCIRFSLSQINEGNFLSEKPSTDIPDHVFLTIRGKERRMDIGVFDGFGADILRRCIGKKLVLLDEIGGVEFLSEPFVDALTVLIKSDTPCIGVYKSDQAFERMQREFKGLQRCEEKRREIQSLLTNSNDIVLLDQSPHDAEAVVGEFIHSSLLRVQGGDGHVRLI